MRHLTLTCFLFAAAILTQTHATPAHAQRAAFEVAVIHEVDPATDEKSALESSLQVTEGRFSARNKTVRELIEYAYDIKQSSEDNITGGPASILSAHYTLTATIPAAGQVTSNEQVRRMLQSLLADRFHLQLHAVPRQVTVQALTPAKSGARLTVAPLREGETEQTRRGGIKSGRGLLYGVAATTDDLVNALATQPEVNTHLVANQTGLGGRYNFELRWNPDQMGTADQTDPSGPSLFTALREQLGLQLVSSKANVDMYVIDHAEKPTAN